MKPPDVKPLFRAIRRIDGWFSPDAAALFALINAAQRSMNVQGNLFEIGVHHGKSTILLCAMANPLESVCVCDIFGEQQANVSKSGSGDRAIFEQNIAAYAKGRNVTVFQKSSADLTRGEIGNTYRFFHIDGGHLVEEALIDLSLAADSLIEKGAIAVDDPFRAEWPGVTEAILQFLKERPDFAPLVLGFNKLILVPRASLKDYESIISSQLWLYISPAIHERKVLPIAGTPTQILFMPTRYQMTAIQPLVARLKRLKLRTKHYLPGAAKH